jgi:hypothetical protein
MDLRPILAAHRERAERDKDAIMTLVRQHSSSSSHVAAAAAAAVMLQPQRQQQQVVVLLWGSACAQHGVCLYAAAAAVLLEAGDVTLDANTACRDGNLDASLSRCLYLLLPLASPCR